MTSKQRQPPRCKPKVPPSTDGAPIDRSEAFAAAVEAAALAVGDPEFRAALLALVAADRREREGAKG